jgi:hypothetical protein
MNDVYCFSFPENHKSYFVTQNSTMKVINKVSKLNENGNLYQITFFESFWGEAEKFETGLG